MSQPTAQPLQRGVRVPLSTGATAASMLLFGTLTLLGALLALAILLPMLRYGGLGSGRERLILLVPLMFLLGSLFFHVLALRARASDVVLDGDGLRVEGGPGDGASFRWGALDLGGCRIETSHDASVGSGSERTYEQRLVLRLRGGEERALASSLDATEQESFAALLETLRALGREAQGAAGGAQAVVGASAAPAAEAAQVLHCRGCGALAVPADAATVRCAFCGAVTEVPEAVRERLRDGGAADRALRRGAARVERLLARPRADQANRWLLGGLAAKYAVPLFLLAAPRLYVTWLALVWVIGRVVKLRLDGRRVLQRLILDFAAPPPAPGQPRPCRCCGGALPAADAAAVLQRCAHCGAENLVGADVGLLARRAQRRSVELGELLLLEGRQRAGQLAWIALGLAVAGYGALRAL